MTCIRQLENLEYKGLSCPPLPRTPLLTSEDPHGDHQRSRKQSFAEIRSRLNAPHKNVLMTKQLLSGRFAGPQSITLLSGIGDLRYAVKLECM